MSKVNDDYKEDRACRRAAQIPYPAYAGKPSGVKDDIFNLNPDQMFINRNRTRVQVFHHRYFIFLAAVFLFSGCTYQILFWERNIWTEFDGIFVIEEPDNLEKYEAFLPEMFDMPEHPMVGLFYADYYDTEPLPVTFTKYLSPYLESAIFIKCEYNGTVGWYCPYMAVTTEAALIGGHRLGYPKILADTILFEKSEGGWKGSTMVDGVEHLGLAFKTDPLDSLELYPEVKSDFIKGNQLSDLVFTMILLRPPAEGPEVVMFSCSPPPLVKRVPGWVSIQLGGPLEGLIESGTVTPALYQHFSMGPNQHPSGPIIALILVVLIVTIFIAVLIWALRRVKRRKPEL